MTTVWEPKYVKACIEHAKDRNPNAVLRGAGRHGCALYIFLSTLNIWHAVRFQKPDDDSVLFHWGDVSPGVLGEYYPSVQFEKLDLRDYGQPMEGLTYSELCEDEEDGRED